MGPFAAAGAGAGDDHRALRRHRGAMPLEAGMFPFHFPHGRGFFYGTNTYGAGKYGIVEYLSMRLNSMFTPFTMHGPYILPTYAETGSPAHRVITAKLSMASHVLTLTQNDNSNDRWPEFNEMESLEYVCEGALRHRIVPPPQARWRAPGDDPLPHHTGDGEPPQVPRRRLPPGRVDRGRR